LRRKAMTAMLNTVVKWGVANGLLEVEQTTDGLDGITDAAGKLHFVDGPECWVVRLHKDAGWTYDGATFGLTVEPAEKP